MFPELRLGSWSVSTYWLCLLLGVVAAGIVFFLRRKRYGIKGGWSLVITLLGALGGMAGAKILFFLEQIGNPQPVVRVGSGFSFYGVIFGLPVFLFLYSKIFGMRAGEFFDYCTPGAVVLFAVLKIGCFLSGCCAGIHADWGLIFPGESQPRIPAQLIESVCAFLIFAGTLAAERHWEKKGLLYPVFMGSYGVIRFAVEFVRDTEKNFAGLSIGQIWSLVAIVIAAAILVVAMKRRPEKE